MDDNVAAYVILGRVAAYLVCAYDAQCIDGMVARGWAQRAGLTDYYYWSEDPGIDERLFNMVYWEKQVEDLRAATSWEYPIPRTYCIACEVQQSVRLGSELIPILCPRHLSPVHMVGLPHVCEKCLSLTNDTVTVMIPGSRNLMDAACSYCGFRRMYIK